MSARIFSKGLICRSHLNQHVLSWFHDRKTPKLYHLPSKQRKSRCNIYHYGNSFNPFEQYKILQVQSETRMSKLQSCPNNRDKKKHQNTKGNHHKPRSKSEQSFIILIQGIQQAKKLHPEVLCILRIVFLRLRDTKIKHVKT